MRILILGVTGMLGNSVFRFLAKRPDFEVHGTLRQAEVPDFPFIAAEQLLYPRLDVTQWEAVKLRLDNVGPDVIINCIGVVKQLAAAEDPLACIPINSLLPHQLSKWCRARGSRLVHISTDCVFSGLKGNYSETDLPDAADLYGRSKLLGEVVGPNCITLRTSIIGHELWSCRSLLNWFLAQSGPIKGFSRAIFSGLPTVELARVICEKVLPKPDLEGLYHVAAQPISKYDLLRLVAEVYGKSIEIHPDSEYSVDRSLNGQKFERAAGYRPPDWPRLVSDMHSFQ